jgi:hypothetical protein
MTSKTLADSSSMNRLAGKLSGWGHFIGTMDQAHIRGFRQKQGRHGAALVSSFTGSD